MTLPRQHQKPAVKGQCASQHPIPEAHSNMASGEVRPQHEEQLCDWQDGYGDNAKDVIFHNEILRSNMTNIVMRGAGFNVGYSIPQAFIGSSTVKVAEGHRNQEGRCAA